MIKKIKTTAIKNGTIMPKPENGPMALMFSSVDVKKGQVDIYTEKEWEEAIEFFDNKDIKELLKVEIIEVKPDPVKHYGCQNKCNDEYPAWDKADEEWMCPKCGYRYGREFPELIEEDENE